MNDFRRTRWSKGGTAFTKVVDRRPSVQSGQRVQNTCVVVRWRVIPTRREFRRRVAARVESFGGYFFLTIPPVAAAPPCVVILSI